MTQIIERPWKGSCATTGLTAEELLSRVGGAAARDGAKAAAIRISRSYNIRGLCDPAYIANVIEQELQRHPSPFEVEGQIVEEYP